MKEQRALLAKVKALLPAKVKEVSLVGDGEFGNPVVLKELESWGWKYALRQSGRMCYQKETSSDKGGWHHLRSLVARGEKARYHTLLLSKTHAFATGLVTQWDTKDATPWLLATNYPTTQSCLKAYRLRMWIEEMFGDMKQHGFNLEASCLRHTDRLDRLTLAVCLLYLWLLAFGSHVIKTGQRKFVDRTSRRDLSLFRIGWDMVHRRLANEQSLTIFLIPHS